MSHHHLRIAHLRLFDVQHTSLLYVSNLKPEKCSKNFPNERGVTTYIRNEVDGIGSVASSTSDRHNGPILQSAVDN